MALNRHPNIPEATRRAVDAAADRIGYKRDSRLSELMAYLRNTKAGRYHETLAFVASYSRENLPHWQQPYLDGAAKQAERLGYKLDYFWAEDPELSKKRLNDILYRRGIRGLLVAPLLNGKSELDLNWDNFSTVAFGYTLARPRVNRITNHHFNSMMMTVRKLAERGYREIALAITPENNQSVNYLWKAGFLTACETLGFDPARLVYVAPFNAGTFYRWYRKHRPEVIIANEASYYLALRDQGLDAPHDFGIVSLTVREKSPKAMTRVDQNHAEQGAAAVNLLAAQLLHGEIGIPPNPRMVLLDSVWVEGETIAAASKRSVRRTPPSSKLRPPLLSPA
jgi:LacI family transcriptional regulator